MLLVFVSFPSEREAKRICEALVKEKLCACASMHPVYSVYRWKGKVEKEREWEAVLKCREIKYEGLEKKIRKMHPHEVPQIIAVKASRALAAYRKWVEES
jgi:periplasmic divalent cation tolerance protein